LVNASRFTSQKWWQLWRSIEYDVLKDLKGLYKLEFAVDGKVHFMTFKDVLSMLPKSWFGKQARAHQARFIHSLARAAYAACYLGISNKPIQIAPLLSEKFTEPGDHKMCCKAPDYSEWLKAMIKEIKNWRKCDDGKLSSCTRQGRSYFESFFLPPAFILLFGLS